MIRIGALASQTGVRVEAIRFYEREKVLPEPRRSDNGRRWYDEADVRRLRLVRHARQLGFDLKSVRSLLALQGVPDGNCESVRSLANNQLRVVRARISQLARLESELSCMVVCCDGARVVDCGILEALEGVDYGPPC
jgi:DNA-binding transcriptional MerR regulator